MDKPEKKGVGRPSKEEEYDTTFQNSYELIFEAFANKYGARRMAEMFNVSLSAVYKWKKTWLAWMDFAEEPPAITRMKEIAKKETVFNQRGQIIKQEHMQRAVSKKSAQIDALRMRSLGISNKILDRIEILISKEKSVGSLAKVLSALLPYVATKQSGDSDKGLTPDEKRIAFIQNVMNVYQIHNSENTNNQNQLEDESDEDDYTDWDPEE